MAKKKNEFEFEQAIEKDGAIIIVSDPSHLLPQAEPTGPQQRPAIIDPAHGKPQEEVKEELRKVKAIDPKHLLPQE
jgi:hypothetical protein